MKRLFTLAMALCLLLGVIALPAYAEDPIPMITWLMSGDNNPPEQNEITAVLSEKFGIDLHVIYTTPADYNTRINTLITSGDEPDLYRAPDYATLLKLRDAGRIIDFEPYLEEYAPDMLSYYGDDIHLPLINRNGGVYTVVSEAGMYLQNFTLRRDWLEAVGMDVPTDLDSLYEVLHAFAYEDPDGNGVKDTYGLSLSTSIPGEMTHIMTAFDIPFASYDNLILTEDGTVTTIMKHPRFAEAMEYMNRLYHEGIIDPDFVTMTAMQSYEALWNGKTGGIDFISIGTTNNWYPGRYTWDVPQDPAEQFVFTFINGNGARRAYSDLSGNAVVINSKCAAPEKALALINYMYYTEEGQDLIYLGIEGVMYQWIDKEQGKYERLGVYTDNVVHRAAGAYVYGGGWTLSNAESRTLNKTTQDAQTEEWKHCLDYPYIVTKTDAEIEYATILSDIVSEAMANLIVTDGDIEAELAQYIERWENEGGLECEVQWTKAYNEEQG